MKGNCFVFQLSTKIRKILDLDITDTISLFIKNVLIAADSLIEEVYEKYKENDGFLYVNFKTMETLGFDLFN